VVGTIIALCLYAALLFGICASVDNTRRVIEDRPLVIRLERALPRLALATATDHSSARTHSAVHPRVTASPAQTVAQAQPLGLPPSTPAAAPSTSDKAALAGLRSALRTSVGCEDSTEIILSAEERQACQARRRVIVAGTPTYDVRSTNPAMAASLDREAAKAEARRKAMQGSFPDPPCVGAWCHDDDPHDNLPR